MLTKFSLSHYCRVLTILPSLISALPQKIGVQESSLGGLQNDNATAIPDLLFSGVECLRPVGLAYHIEVNDCAEALYGWLLLTKETPGVQSFSSKNSGLETDEEVPFGKIERTCLALVDVLPGHQEDEDRFTLLDVYQALLAIQERCIKGSKQATGGGFVWIGRNQGFFAQIRHPKPYPVGQSYNNSTDAPNDSDDLSTGNVAGTESDEGPPLTLANDRSMAEPPPATQLSRRIVEGDEASESTVMDETPPQFNSSSLLTMIHPACFQSPVSLTNAVLWPAVHEMQTTYGGLLWHTKVQWGGPRGQQVPRVFHSDSVTITINSIANPPTKYPDTFSLHEAWLNLAWLIKECAGGDFRGGFIGVGRGDMFYIEAQATQFPNSLSSIVNSTGDNGLPNAKSVPVGITATE